MERRFEVLAELVNAEDKIKGEYNTIQDMKEGISQMHDTLFALKKEFAKNIAWAALLHDLKSIERGDMQPCEISTGDLLKEIIRASASN